MRHARRLIITLIGVTFWCVAATTAAYAQRITPPGGDITPPQPPPPAPTPEWKYVLLAAGGALLAVALVGLIASVRHSRQSQPSRMLQA